MFHVVILYSFVVYLYVSGSGSITSVGELICLLLFTCNYVVSVWRGSLFLWVLGMSYVILLWHSLSLPYNYFGSLNSINNLYALFCGAYGLSSIRLLYMVISKIIQGSES